MKIIPRKFVDWERTGINLQRLREHNENLRRSVCDVIRHSNGKCNKESCEGCELDMDNHISRAELAEVFGVTEHVIFNWESGRTEINYDNLLFYSELTKLDVNDIVLFTDSKKR